MATFSTGNDHDPAQSAPFESAVQAVVKGDLPTLRSLLARYPDLVKARSEREHRATLLHYIGANGVEDENQSTPDNAVEVAKTLLHAGAEADAPAYMYGGQHTTLRMLVSSAHPARAGLQVALANVLLDFGAAVEGTGDGVFTSPLLTSLAFGYLPVARTLVARGARVDHVAAAAGLGMLVETGLLFENADAQGRHRALVLAAQLGHTEVVRLLLDRGEDPNRYNPEGNHGHSTPLHQAAVEGHLEVVRLLTEKGARPDIQDKIWEGTPLDWAVYAGKTETANFLRSLKND